MARHDHKTGGANAPRSQNPDAPRSQSLTRTDAAPSGADHANSDTPKMKSDIAGIILDLTRARGGAKSICPSEAARALAADAGVAAWQSFMKPVRQAAIQLARAGKIEILRKGKPVALPPPTDDVRGVIRLRIAGEPQGTNVEQKA
jgi:hypothetical protein